MQRHDSVSSLEEQDEENQASFDRKQREEADKLKKKMRRLKSKDDKRKLLKQVSIEFQQRVQAQYIMEQEKLRHEEKTAMKNVEEQLVIHDFLRKSTQNFREASSKGNESFCLPEINTGRTGLQG